MQIAIKPTCQAPIHIDCFADPAEIRRSIEAKAFELYKERGGAPGHALDDWLEAEEQVLGVRHEPTRCIH